MFLTNTRMNLIWRVNDSLRNPVSQMIKPFSTACLPQSRAKSAGARGHRKRPVLASRFAEFYSWNHLLSDRNSDRYSDWSFDRHFEQNSDGKNFQCRKKTEGNNNLKIYLSEFRSEMHMTSAYGHWLNWSVEKCNETTKKGLKQGPVEIQYLYTSKWPFYSSN